MSCRGSYGAWAWSNPLEPHCQMELLAQHLVLGNQRADSRGECSPVGQVGQDQVASVCCQAERMVPAHQLLMHSHWEHMRRAESKSVQSSRWSSGV